MRGLCKVGENLFQRQALGVRCFTSWISYTQQHIQCLVFSQTKKSPGSLINVLNLVDQVLWDGVFTQAEDLVRHNVVGMNCKPLRVQMYPNTA